jgi:raffinose/stachyose/melibiose transport system substrate-binding protein
MDQWETYCRQFEAKVLEEQNIKLTINLEMPSSDQYESVLQARLTGDDAPDLYTVHCNNLEVYNTAGNLVDLSDQPFVSKLYENVRDTVTIDGKVLAVPIESMAWGVLYNKAIFAECGLTPPSTLDDLKNIVEVLESKGIRRFCWRFRSSGCRS